MTPIYVQEMFNIKITSYDLRDLCRTVMTKAKTTTHGLKSLTYEGNRIWNSLPAHIKGAESLGIFKDRISKWQPKFLNIFYWYIKLFLFIMFISNCYLTL